MSFIIRGGLMEYLVNSREMKLCDFNTINKLGMPSMVLMERAALAVVEELEGLDLGKVLVVCGKGNNGGDGFAIGRLLHLKGIQVEILFIDEEEGCSQETKEQIKIARNYGVKILDQVEFNKYTTIIDALLGIGLSRKVRGKYAEIIDEINKTSAYILAVDIPSGISADDGKVLGTAVRAHKTVTFAFKKIGLVLYPGAEYAGELVVKDIGINHLGFEKSPKTYSHTPEDLKLVPKRRPYSNKGSYGKVLVIAGSLNMAGAAYLSAKASYRMGVGLVYIYTVEENREILQTLIPEAVLTGYNRVDLDEGTLIGRIKDARVIVIGPGMGISKATRKILELVLREADVPLIIDADAINVLSQDLSLLDNHDKDIIITPHLGEMARLIKKDIPAIREDIVGVAREFAFKKDLICVLKDARTIIADREGHIYINQSGSDAMATGGSGDVLTGVIAGLIAQGLNPKEAASLGVYIHGLAGQEAAKKVGNYGLMAGDIIDGLIEVVNTIIR